MQVVTSPNKSMIIDDYNRHEHIKDTQGKQRMGGVIAGLIEIIPHITTTHRASWPRRFRGLKKNYSLYSVLW